LDRTGELVGMRVITSKGYGHRTGASSDGTITVMLDNGRILAMPADQVAPAEPEGMDESDRAEAVAQAACEGFDSVEAWVADARKGDWVGGFLAWADDNAHRVDPNVVTGEVVPTPEPVKAVEDKTVVITGDKIAGARELMMIHGWKNAANMKVKFGMSSKRFPSVKAFNEQYGVKVKTWAQILEITTSVLADMRQGS
jgi:hypothetical protein